MKRLNILLPLDKLNILTCLLTLALLSSLFLPSMFVKADELELDEPDSYVLSFDLEMPAPNCFVKILEKHKTAEEALLEELPVADPEQENADVDVDSSDIDDIGTEELDSHDEAEKAFTVDYTLLAQGQEADVAQHIQYRYAEGAWSSDGSFAGAVIPYPDLEIQFYELDEDGFVAEGQLHYNLYLKTAETEEKMILLLPKLSVYDDQGNIIDQEELLNVANVQTVSVREKGEKVNNPGSPAGSPDDPQPRMTPLRSGTIVYLGGAGAKDENSGMTPTDAVASFGKAKEIVLENPSITKIVAQGITPLSGEINFTNLDNPPQIVRADNYNGYLFYVAAGTSATLSNIVIDGNSTQNTFIQKSLIYVGGKEQLASLVLSEGAILQNNKIGQKGFGGAIYAASAAQIVMNGGVIKDNSAEQGGGIYGHSISVDYTAGDMVSNYASYGGGLYLFNSSFNLSHGSIGGASEDTANRAYYGAGMYLQNSQLSLSGNAIIQNNITPATGPTKGGGIYAINSKLEMTGGMIQSNQSVLGAGLCLDSDSTLNFSDGIVQKNSSKLFTDSSVSPAQFNSAGGGILAINGSSIFMSGNAKVLENTAEEVGAGIAIGSNGSTKGSQLTMTGGLIDGNKVGGNGGGIFVQAGYKVEDVCRAYISGGRITNNQVVGGTYLRYLHGGGGIYVNGSNETHNGELYLTNFVVTNNTSQKEGAGFSACPCSESNFYITDGGAFYGNFADGYSDDLYITANAYSNPSHSATPQYEIPRRMLGAVPYHWLTQHDLPLEESKYKNALTSGLSLNLHTEARPNALTEQLTQVIISGNSAVLHGGGIGSNGTVIFGKPSTTEISVSKEWNDNNNADKKRPEAIEVELLAEFEGESYIIDSVVLHAGNQWHYTFDNLPTEMKGQAAKYTVREISVAGYTGTVTGDAVNGFVITNTPQEAPPEETVPRLDFPLKITVHKEWLDNDNARGLRPGKVTVFLYADGKSTGKYVFLEPERAWTASFWDLPEYDGDHKIEYSVKEEAVSNYDSSVSGDPANGFVVTNTLNLWPQEMKEKVENLPRTGERSTGICLSVLMLASGLALVLKKRQP